MRIFSDIGAMLWGQSKKKEAEKIRQLESRLDELHDMAKFCFRHCLNDAGREINEAHSVLSRDLNAMRQKYALRWGKLATKEGH